jgi:hypothetical protein
MHQRVYIAAALHWRLAGIASPTKLLLLLLLLWLCFIMLLLLLLTWSGRSSLVPQALLRCLDGSPSWAPCQTST